MDAKLQECPAVQLRNLWTASKYPKLAVWSEQISLFLTNLFSPEFPYEQFETEALTSAPTRISVSSSSSPDSHLSRY